MALCELQPRSARSPSRRKSRSISRRWESITSAGKRASRWRSRRRPKDLAAYAPQIERLKAQGGYVTADVIDVNSQTPGLDAMLARLNTEHWHDEDEIRYIIAGRGSVSHSPEARAGGGDRGGGGRSDPRAAGHAALVRSFLRAPHSRDSPVQDPAGWTPHYTQSGVDRGYDPVCFGPAYISPDFFGELALAAAALDEGSIRAILLDIEGTTTPVDFVYKTLLPYARERAPNFFARIGTMPDVREDVAGLRAQHQADAAANLGPPPWASVRGRLAGE